MALLSMSQALAMYRDVHQAEPSFGMNVLASDFEPKEIVILQSHSQRKEGVPVRCDYYTMVFCLEGGATRYINQFEYQINAHSLHLLPPGAIHSFKDRFSVTNYYVLLFEQNFSKETELLAFHNSHLNSVDLASDLFVKVKCLFEEIESELKAEKVDNKRYAQCLLNQILLILKREKLKINNDVDQDRADIICSQFLALLELHFKNKKTVYDYAGLMSISAKHLSETVKSKLGNSALFFIHQRMIKEAKYLLVFSNKNVYQIALELGFQDPAQFSKLFKQKVAKTPKQYRIDNSNMMNEAALNS